MTSPETESSSRVARLRQRRNALTQTAEGARLRLETRRPESRLVDLVFRLVQRDRESAGSLLAGALAFRFFMVLVPYVVVLMAGFGFAADASDESPAAMADRAGIRGLAAKAIDGLATLSVGQRVSALVVAGIALVTGSRALVRALRLTSALVWNQELGPRPGVTRDAVRTVVVITALFAAGGVLGKLRASSPTLGMVVTIAAVALPVAAAFLLARMLPQDPASTWRDAIPGALLLGIAIHVLHLVTVLYVARSFSAKSETYGALGSALAILVWAYLLGRSVVAATALNSVRFEQRKSVAE